MTPGFAAKIGLTLRSTNVGAEKNDGSPLKSYDMVSAELLLQDSLGRVRFFEKTFLLADTNMVVVLGMPFLSLSNVDFKFGAKEFNWRSYTTAETLPIARRVELIDKHEFARTALHENSETFVVHVAALINSKLAIHPSRAYLLPTLQQDKAPTEITPKYADYADVFSPDLAMKLSENTDINEHAIELVEGKQ